MEQNEMEKKIGLRLAGQQQRQTKREIHPEADVAANNYGDQDDDKGSGT